jgi:septal ring factor EnvC (AmiA/AmiB activator)
LTTPSCGATAAQSKALENELKQIESEVETNTKISELESKSESKTQSEADAANTAIFDQEKEVNRLVEDVSVINDKTEYAEAQKEVIMEQKQEEKFEGDVVKIEVESYRANQTAISEESTLREMSSESQ